MKQIPALEKILMTKEYINVWISNEFINKIPFHLVRILLYRMSGVTLGRDSSICLHSQVNSPKGIFIGDNCAINQHVYLDGRGKLTIKNNVNIGRSVQIYTASHDYNSPNFIYITKPVTVEKNAWIASNAIILPGVCIGEGAVVAAGSVVTKNVHPFEVVGGSPAKKIGRRNKKISYQNHFFRPFY